MGIINKIKAQRKAVKAWMQLARDRAMQIPGVSATGESQVGYNALFTHAFVEATVTVDMSDVLSPKDAAIGKYLKYTATIPSGYEVRNAVVHSDGRLVIEMAPQGDSHEEDVEEADTASA